MPNMPIMSSMQFLDHEPPPFEVVNPKGGAALLIACDHAQNRIPAALDNLGLTTEHLQSHIAYDIGARQVARRLAERFDAPLLLANYSRLVIDLNRYLHDRSSIAAQADDIPIPANVELSEAARTARAAQLFTPYHEQYARLVMAAQHRHRQPIILSVHSFTPCLHGQARAWGFGVLWTEKHQVLAQKLLAGLRAHTEHIVGDNQPYHANDPQGYAQVVHAENNQLEMALLEIRQDLIADAPGQQQAADTIYRVLAPLLA